MKVQVAQTTVKKEVIKLNQNIMQIPNYQRNFVMPLKAQVRLIEDILDGTALIPVFVTSGKASSPRLLDGKQRLTTFQRFMGNQFKLSKKYGGKTFMELDKVHRTKLENASLSILHYGNVKYHQEIDLFQNINSGRKLNKDQMAKAKYEKLNHKLFIHILKFSTNKEYRDVFDLDSNKTLEPESTLVKIMTINLSEMKFGPAGIPLNKFLQSNFDSMSIVKDINHVNKMMNRTIKYSKYLMEGLKSKTKTTNKAVILLGIITKIEDSVFDKNKVEIDKIFQKCLEINISTYQTNTNDTNYGEFLRTCASKFNKYL